MREQENVYDNKEAPVILFKSRTNSMSCRDKKRHQNEAAECIMCGDGHEDLRHSILHCPAYNIERKNPTLQWPDAKVFFIGCLLFTNQIIQAGTTLHKFWIRNKKIKESGDEYIHRYGKQILWDRDINRYPYIVQQIPSL